MAKPLRFYDGPCAGHEMILDGPIPGQVSVEVDEDGAPTNAGVHLAFAVYNVQESGNELVGQLTGFSRRRDFMFELEFVDGPGQRVVQSPWPARYMEAEQEVYLGADGSTFSGRGYPAAVAVYERREDGGKAKYFLRHIEESGELVKRAVDTVKESKRSQAIKSFYLSPDYGIYSIKPTEDHVQVSVEVGYRRGRVDEGIAPLIEQAWRLGLDTFGSCQQRRAGTKNEGLAYVGFARADDAKRFEQFLTAADIPCTFEATKFGIAHDGPDGTRDEKLVLDAGNVLFRVEDILRITVSLRTAPAPIRLVRMERKMES